MTDQTADLTPDAETSPETPEGSFDIQKAAHEARGVRPAGAVEPLDNEEIHPGLDWVADPLGRARIQAKSESHEATWVIDLTDDSKVLWRAFPEGKSIFVLEDVPAEPFGRFPSHQEAARHALIADFQIFRRTAQARGHFASLKHAEAFDDAAFGGDARPFQLAASFVKARTKALKKNPAGNWDFTLTVEGELPQWLINAPLAVEILAGLLQLGHADDREGTEARKRVEDAIRRSAMRPIEPEFQFWLQARYDSWGLIRAAMAKDSNEVENATRETLRRLTGVPSLGDFRFNLDAVARFEAIDREYYFDMAAQKGIWTPNRPR